MESCSANPCSDSKWESSQGTLKGPRWGPQRTQARNAQHACDGPSGQPGVLDVDPASPAASRLVAPCPEWPGLVSEVLAILALSTPTIQKTGVRTGSAQRLGPISKPLQALKLDPLFRPMTNRTLWTPGVQIAPPKTSKLVAQELAWTTACASSECAQRGSGSGSADMRHANMGFFPAATPHFRCSRRKGRMMGSRSTT